MPVMSDHTAIRRRAITLITLITMMAFELGSTRTKARFKRCRLTKKALPQLRQQWLSPAREARDTERCRQRNKVLPALDRRLPGSHNTSRGSRLQNRGLHLPYSPETEVRAEV